MCLCDKEGETESERKIVRVKILRDDVIYDFLELEALTEDPEVVLRVATQATRTTQ